MKNKTYIAIFATFLFLFFASMSHAQQAAPEQKPATSIAGVQIKFDITLGGQIRDISGSKSSKFQYARDIPQGFLLRDFSFAAEKPDKPYYFSLIGREAGERDQNYYLRFENFGKYRLDVEWTQYPRFLADRTQTLFVGTGNGVLTIPDVIQTAFAAAPDAINPTVPPAPDLTLPGLIRGVLASTPFGRQEILRRRFGLRYEYQPAQYWRLHFGVQRELRSGARPASFGAYIRVNTPTGSYFANPGVELPEPVNFHTTEFSAGVSYERQRGFIAFEYLGSLFRNKISTVTFDNPFRIADSEATSAGSLNRYAFARAQIDLEPDNTAHTFSVIGAYNFPHNTRLAGAVSFSSWRQDDNFLPWTLNTAVVTGVPAGVIPTNPGTLPQPDLNGKVFTHSEDWALSSRLTDTFRFTLRYRLYDYNNDSDRILFPGFVGRGDSFWRSNVGGLPIESELAGFFRQRSSVEAVWQPIKQFSWKNELGWEGWNREDRQVGRTNEWIGKTQLIWKPIKRFSTRAHYHYGNRIPRGTYNPGLEFAQLRMFDQAHRLQHNADVRFQFDVNDQFNFTGVYQYNSNRYDTNFYGAATSLQGFVTVEANYIPEERVSFRINYTHDRLRSTYRSISRKPSGADPNNAFVRNNRDRLDSVGAGLSLTGFENKLSWDTDYTFSGSRVQISTFNPLTITADNVLNAQAFPFPEIEDNLHEFRTTVSYRFRPNVQLGVRYLFEPRSLQDFTWDILSPYVRGREAQPENDLRRYLFLDARDGDYHGHAAAIFLRYTF